MNAINGLLSRVRRIGFENKVQNVVIKATQRNRQNANDNDNGLFVNFLKRITQYLCI